MNSFNIREWLFIVCFELLVVFLVSSFDSVYLLICIFLCLI